MKRKQTRYTSEAQILEAIDAAKSKLEELRKESLELTQEAKIGRFGGAKERLLKVEAAVRRIEDVRLPKLKSALAAFRTELMPFTQDRGVVLQ